MIALILYDADIPGYSDIKDKFDTWYYYYRRSKTEMKFQIFTDQLTYNRLPKIREFPTIPMPAIVPNSIDRDSLLYGDWLRSELYDMISHQFLYLDIDCLILRPIDDIFTGLHKNVHMAPNNLGQTLPYNNGVIIFNSNVKKMFQDKCLAGLESRTDHDKRDIYGLHVWSDICKTVGGSLHPKYNFSPTYLWDIEREPDKYKIPDDIRILHCAVNFYDNIIKLCSMLGIQHQEFDQWLTE